MPENSVDNESWYIQHVRSRVSSRGLVAQKPKSLLFPKTPGGQWILVQTAHDLELLAGVWGHLAPPPPPLKPEAHRDAHRSIFTDRRRRGRKQSAAASGGVKFKFQVQNFSMKSEFNLDFRTLMIQCDTGQSDTGVNRLLSLSADTSH